MRSGKSQILNACAGLVCETLSPSLGNLPQSHPEGKPFFRPAWGWPDYKVTLLVPEFDNRQYKDFYCYRLEMEPAAKAGTASKTLRGPTPEATGSNNTKDGSARDVKS